MPPRRRPGPRAVAALAVVASAVAALPAVASSLHGPAEPGVRKGTVTPTSPTGRYRDGALLMNGRLLTPVGATSPLGDFPTAVAVSPDSRLAVVANTGQGSGSAEQGDESLQLVDAASGRVLQTVTDHDAGKPTFYNNGLAWSHDGRHVYATGGGNDAVYDYVLEHGRLHRAHAWLSTRRHGTPTVGLGTPVEGIPATAPEVGDIVGFSKDVAVTPDGATLVVSNEQGGSVAGISTATGAIAWETQLAGNQLHVGAYPAGLALSPDGKSAYVTAQGLNLLYVLDTATGAITGAVPVGDHPTDVAVSRTGRFAVVANANDDSVSVVEVSATPPSVVSTISTKTVAGEANGASPSAVTIDERHGRVYVTNSGDDDVAALGVDSGNAPLDPARLRLLGHLPTAFYPSAVATRADGTVLVTNAKGWGGIPVTDRKQYDGNDMVGLFQRVARPTARSLRAATAASARDLTWGRRSDRLRPAGSPIPDAAHAGQSPIKHVVLVVRENRTFDQIFGDLRTLGRRDADVEPRYLEFGLRDRQGRTITPNAHAFASRFAISDNFYSDGEASIQGHYWTADGVSTDYGEKAWLHNYSDRNHTYDPVWPIEYPRCGALFQHLARSGVSFRNFGELVGVSTAQAPRVSDVPGDQCGQQPGGLFDAQSVASASPTYPNNLTLTTIPDTDRITDFEKEYAPLVAANQVPALSYVLLGNDHTDGTASGKKTPQAHVATNDLALGQLVDYLSHTPQWSSTAVFVMEDDSQDGLDHRDGHRNVLLVASPWAKRGAIGHIHVSQVSVLHTIELILGLRPLSAYTQFAPVPWDMFTSRPDARPYSAITPTYPLNATNGAAAPGTPAAVPTNLSLVDLAGPVLEAQLWQATHPGTPLPAQMLSELAARSGVTPQAISAWSQGLACRCRLLREGLTVALGAGDADG